MKESNENSQEKVYPYYLIDGKAYDLKEWIPKHPGGSVWFARSHGRDITAAVYSYHPSPKYLLEILKKYEVNIEYDEALDPSLNVPAFILPQNFNAKTDSITFDWSKEDSLFNQVQQRLKQKPMKEKIQLADKLFDIVAVLIFLSHLFMSFVGLYYDLLPLWGFVIFFVLSRTSMAAVGHYHCHRAKDGIRDWADGFFDIQYVGANLILYDGHVLLHHLYTNTHADVKRTVFTALLDLPRLLRVPIYTIHRFGQFLTGMLIRWHNILYETHFAQWNLLKHIEFFIIRFIMIGEFFFALYIGKVHIWFAQFVAVIWWNLFLIVSSHDFEQSETKADISHGQDWGCFQIKNSFDMSVVGIKAIDCFLTAGLGTHRVHHVLPGQKSGFANIVSFDTVRDVAVNKFKLEWVPTKNYVFQRLPGLINFYLLAPGRLPYGEEDGIIGWIKEALTLDAFKSYFTFIYLGFKGVGSI